MTRPTIDRPTDAVGFRLIAQATEVLATRDRISHSAAGTALAAHAARASLPVEKVATLLITFSWVPISSLTA